MTKPNRLINEQSPYLLQHAYNPVEWYPWCDEAFEKARNENKPIFLSIGYSTCHWCHVMEQESFEDTDIAKLLNQTFVSIKVDREERPDIDGVYMTVCQMLAGSGGWPMTIVMTPDKKPFFAGTYFPKHNRHGRIGMLELIPKLDELWKIKQNDIIKSAEEISENLQTLSHSHMAVLLTPEIFKKAYNELSSRFDRLNGGFGTSPKFPTPHVLTFLLRYWKKYKDENALHMVEKTLTQMRLGGIYDQIGFGFHRYSTDKIWLVPHFEKMLYDQALLTIAYLDVYQATKNDFYKQTAIEILEYVRRVMMSPNGTFFSAEDADSENQEGKFYLWTLDEIKETLGKDAELVIDYFNAESGGNWIDPVHGNNTNTNILHIKKNINEIAEIYALSIEELDFKLNAAVNKLYVKRGDRIHPFKDDKILTDWNSLMISAFLKAAQVLGDEKYTSIAINALNFILTKMTDSEGKLMHRYRNGNSAISGTLDDYAFFISALIDMYETTSEISWLVKAMKYHELQMEYFWDKVNGGFFFTAAYSEELIFRQKEIYDGAIPSGNSVSLINLLRMYHLTGNPDFGIKADELIKAFSKLVSQQPSSFTYLLSGLDFYFGPVKEILIIGADETSREKFIKIINGIFLPNKVVLCKNKSNSVQLEEIAKYTSTYPIEGDKTSIYICEDFMCKLPIHTLEELIKTIAASD
ncbi:MAG: thioredoxin domain-containing protein [Ignavibacteriaceae bacterium]|nr:thioredoxin domain-containing protein [Ignavibacteriaceae bacterium]